MLRSDTTLIIFQRSAANLPADCINLGQGYMNFPPPEWIITAAEAALREVAPNHYSHPRGRIRLREALKKFYDPLFDRTLDVESDILVTSGANEGMICRQTTAPAIYFQIKGNIPFSLRFWIKATKSSCLNPFLTSTFHPWFLMPANLYMSHYIPRILQSKSLRVTTGLSILKNCGMFVLHAIHSQVYLHVKDEQLRHAPK